VAHHHKQDFQSLMLHTAAVKLMQDDPRLVERAIGILNRWCMDTEIHSRPLLEEWKRILNEHDWEMALSTSERGNQLRQASPVSCVLPNQKRLEIIRTCKNISLNT
jgi:hypothetical protein